MNHGNDYPSYYSPPYNPLPNSNSNYNSAPIHPSFASAPPFSNYPSDPHATSYADPYYATSYPHDHSQPNSVANPQPNYPHDYSQQSSVANPQPNYPHDYSQQNPQPNSVANPQPNYPLDYSQQNPQPNYPHLQQTYYPYDTAPNSNPIGGPTGSYPAPYDANYPGSSLPADNSGAGYGGYLNNSDFMDAGMRFDRLSLGDGSINEGVYAYDGGRAEPYGARGTVPTRSPALFDDYGRSLSQPSSGKDGGGSSAKIVRAVPKAEAQQDVKNGVMKYRVKLLSESGGSAQDVLCQIGLDGIRMLDPSTNRTLRIHPLESLTRWEITDSSTFSFWSKSSVDIEPRRIRLQSNSYTTNTILDTVTAATVQLKEMGGNDSLTRGKGAADAAKQTEQAAEKKKGLIDWMNMIKPVNEEKDHWVPDDVVNKCTACGSDFGAFNRRHHCRNCGDIFCDKCTQGRIALTNEENAQPVRVCDGCMAEVSQRLTNAKEATNRPAALHSHEDLARKLQEEMEKNRKSSLGSKSSDSSGRRMREVACPICTVHLQVQVPASGSETIECGVCQHPFLVSAH